MSWDKNYSVNVVFYTQANALTKYRQKKIILAWPSVSVASYYDAIINYLVNAAIPGSVATDAETDKCRKYNDLLENYYFQPVAIETTGVYGKSTAPFLSCLAKKHVDMSFQVTPGSDNDSTSTCLWPWSEGTPPAYWPVRKLGVSSATLSALTSVAAHHLPLLSV